MKRTSIHQKDFDGDITFFDNRYCYTSGNPHYKRFIANPNSNRIVTTRLMDYQSPARTDYIFMQRTGTAEDCFFDIELVIPEIAHADNYFHKYYKMEGDFKADCLQEIRFLVQQNKPVEREVAIGVSSHGDICADDFRVKGMILEGQWFHLLWFINLENHTSDVYVNGRKVLCNISLPKDMNRLDLLRVSLAKSEGIGDLYIDHFDVTGLVKPIVEGKERKTTVIMDDENIIDFMKDKVGMHAYGNILYKDGEKKVLTPKGFYDKREEQYYVTVDTLNEAFSLSLREEEGEIAGDIQIKENGLVTRKDQSTFLLDYAPKRIDGKIYIPVRQFAEDILGKCVWWFKTGLIIFSDYLIDIDSSNWEYHSIRKGSQCTIWNDIDYLNCFLQYVRPDAIRLKKDYIFATGDSSFTQHPRIFYTQKDFDSLKKAYDRKEDFLLTQKLDQIVEEADSYIHNHNMVTYRFQDKMRQFNCVSKALGDRFKAWGYAYQLTGMQKYVDAAYEQFEIAKTFPDFNTAHIIDTGEAALSLAIGYDWFYQAFTPEQRKLACSVVRRQCLDILASGLYGRITSSSDGAIEWRAFKWMSNYNAIVNTGVIVAALATLEEKTDEAFGYIADALRSIEYTMQMFAPGGSWNEGPNYWDFTMRYLVAFSANMERNFGSTYNIMDGQGVKETLDFIISCIGTVGSNNMGDGNMITNFSYDSFFYLSVRYANPVPAFMRMEDLKAGTAKMTFYDLVFGHQAMNDQVEKAVFEQVSKMQRIDGMEVFSIRDSYVKQASNLYFSAHFGTTSGYHQHYDCGTFVLDLAGERWAFDLGSDNYLLQNELGYPVYSIFRKRAEAHNILVLNPEKYTNRVETENGHFAPILDAQANEYSGFVYADMSEVYEDASEMLLGYYMDDDMSSVTMRNEFVLPRSCKGMWSMITGGTVRIEDNIAYISKNSKAIKLEAMCTGNKLYWQDGGNPKPLKTSPQCPEQNRNEGYTQLRLWFEAEAGRHFLAVKISLAEKTTKPMNHVPITQWKLCTK